MKKSLLLLALTTFIITSAQVKGKGTFEITPKIGYSTFAEVLENDRTDSNSGVSLGVTVDYYFNNRWSLRSGFSADKMGGEYSFDKNKFEDKLNYISIPINANWHFGSTRKWNLNFGLSPSFLTSAKVVNNGKESKISKEFLKSSQLGFSYGIGYKIEVNKKFGLLLEAQFFSGLTNISNIPENSYINAGGGYNIGAVIQL
jgi:hypothetical protein